MVRPSFYRGSCVGKEGFAPLGAPLFVPVQPAFLAPQPQGGALVFGSSRRFQEQDFALLWSDGGRAAAQAAGAVEGGPNSVECGLRIFRRVFGLRDNGSPEFRTCSQDPRLAGVFTLLSRHLLLCNSHAQYFVPAAAVSLKIIVGRLTGWVEGQEASI